MIGASVDALRAYSRRLMRSTVTVYRWDDSSFDPEDPGASGGWSKQTETVGRLEASGQASDRDVADQQGLAQSWQVLLPHDVDVREADRLTVAGVDVLVRTVHQTPDMAHTRVVGVSPSEAVG